MSVSSLSQTTRFRAPSTLSVEGEGRRLSLVTAVPSEPSRQREAKPQDSAAFLNGSLRFPKPFADALLVVGRVARTRFFTPPGMLARIIAESDPVITVDASHLRLEAFSPCCGVHVRLDVPLGLLEADVQRRGTTNVDVGPELRRWLTSVDGKMALGLQVGEDAFEVSDERGAVIERKVELPARWLAGFLEVQAAQRTLEEVHALNGPAALRALQGLPRAATKGGIALVPTGQGLRVGRPGSRGAFVIGGHERLGLFDGVASSLRSLRIHADPRFPTLASPSAWVAELEGELRLTVMLSPERWRGFSGEGQALQALAGADDESLDLVRGALGWQGTVDPAALTAGLGASLGQASVERAMAVLGAQGLLGFDLTEGRYFHRVLPFDALAVDRRQPRLLGATRLVEAGAVRRDAAADAGTFWVASGDVDYRVVLSPDISGGGSCTCTWFGQHQGARGPCKHVLAATIWNDDSDA